MKKIAVILLAGLVIVTAQPLDSYAGPWTLKQGKAWTEVFSRYSTSKYAYGSNGNISRWNNGGFQNTWDVEGKLEYGISDNVNFLFGLPYAWTTWKDDYVVHGNNEKLKNEGFKELNVGLKYRFLQKPVVAAVQVKGYIDMQMTTERSVEPQISEYGNAVEFRGLVGKSFNINKKTCYVAAESGFKLKMKGHPNENEYANTVPVFVECGYAPLDWLMFKGEIDSYFSIPGTGRVKDSAIWRVGPIFSFGGRGFSSFKKGGENSINIELLYGQSFYGRGDPDLKKGNPTWPNRDDRVGAVQEFIFKVQVLF
ncbi:MAG: hypothetical protein ABH883_02470 [Candidatus Omnitrophota bacterium]